MISGDEYKAIMDQVGLIGSIVADLDLEGCQELAVRADSVAPVLFPSEWIKGRQNTDDAKALLRPLIAFQREVMRIRERAPSPTSKAGEN